eukprot:6490968-Amphidinium_carterae.6
MAVWRRHQWAAPLPFVPYANEAPKKYVTEVFRFFLASDTCFPNSEGFMSPNFMPDPSKGSIESCAGALILLSGALFKMSHSLIAKAVCQTCKIRSLGDNISQ